MGTIQQQQSAFWLCYNWMLTAYTVFCTSFHVSYVYMVYKFLCVLWLVCRIGYSVRHINEVEPCWTRLVQGFVTTFGGSTIPVLIPATEPDHASVGRRSVHSIVIQTSLLWNAAAQPVVCDWCTLGSLYHSYQRKKLLVQKITKKQIYKCWQGKVVVPWTFSGGEHGAKSLSLPSPLQVRP